MDEISFMRDSVFDDEEARSDWIGLKLYFTLLAVLAALLVVRYWQQSRSANDKGTVPHMPWLFNSATEAHRATDLETQDRVSRWRNRFLWVLSLVVFGGVPHLVFYIAKHIRRKSEEAKQAEAAAKAPLQPLQNQQQQSTSFFENSPEPEQLGMSKEAQTLLKSLSENAWVIPKSKIQFLHQIGAGAFGLVRTGTFNSTQVAIKCLPPPEFHESEDEHVAKLKALHREITVLTNIRHPNVVLFMGVCLDPLCMVTEFCQKGSLFDVLQRAQRDKHLLAILSWQNRIRLALEAALGMAHLHSSDILHRDLKSPNLLVDKAWHVKVGDFGLSSLTGSQAATMSRTTNNPRWLAPEVAQGARFNQASDVYSYAIILWEILTLQEPYANMTTGQILFALATTNRRPEIPDLKFIPGGAFPGIVDYIRVMKCCWHPDPSLRPSFAQIVNALRRLLSTMRRKAAGARQ